MHTMQKYLASLVWMMIYGWTVIGLLATLNEIVLKITMIRMGMRTWVQMKPNKDDDCHLK